MNLSDDYKYGFLIGVIEGEGCVHIQHIGKNKDNLTGNVSIVNTDKNLIEFLDQILKLFNFKYTVRKHNTEEYLKKTGYKEAWRITITNRIDFQKLFENYHIEGSRKKENLRILLEKRKRKIYARRL
ncbi:MAG: LAGLIDADG family homing endonuclease [Candidatus Aenigmatarchaeota archaeon]